MSAYEDLEGGSRYGWFVRAAGVVGDLGSPFYREERQRDVWNEASAVGLQTVLLLGLAAATGMVWLGGAPGLPYAATILVVVGVASWMTLLYASALGVTIDDPAGLLRLRLVPYAVLLVLFLVGAARVAPEGGFLGGFVQGGVVGAAAAALVLLWSGLRARRRQRRGYV
jgi:hypothetical protein